MVSVKKKDRGSIEKHSREAKALQASIVMRNERKEPRSSNWIMLKTEWTQAARLMEISVRSGALNHKGISN